MLFSFFFSSANAQESEVAPPTQSSVEPLNGVVATELPGTAAVPGNQVQEILSTIELILQIGAGAFVALGFVVIYLFGRSYSDIRKELSVEISEIRDFTESRSTSKRNLKEDIADIVRSNFQNLFDEVVERRLNTNYPTLEAKVKAAQETVNELKHMLQELPQYDPAGRDASPDYLSTQKQSEAIRAGRNEEIFAAASAANKDVPAELLDLQLKPSYEKANIDVADKRNKARNLFSSAVAAAQKAISKMDSDPFQRKLLDANTFYNLSAEAGKWGMPDYQTQFAQIAYLIEPNALHEAQAIQTALSGVVSSDGSYPITLGFESKSESFDGLERLKELLKTLHPRSPRHIIVGIGWNVANHTKDYLEIYDLLEDLLKTETDDPSSWVDISYTNTVCAQIAAHMSWPNWKEDAKRHLNRARLKMEYESVRAPWYESTQARLAELEGDIFGDPDKAKMN